MASLHQGNSLSDLPESIIENILVFLPIRDAIRTSILSTEWRFRWTTLPHLVFDQMDDQMDINSAIDYVYGDVHESDPCFRTLVTRTLQQHKGPLHKFKIFTFVKSCAETDEWLNLLLSKDLKELILELTERFDVPSCLYLFQSLTFLLLDECVFSPPPPNFRGFPCLRTLIIQHLDVPISTIQSVVEQSPLLEVLDWTGHLYSDSPLIISAPNLKYLNLKFYDHLGENVCFYAPLLAKLSVSVILCESYGLLKNATYCYYTKFLGGFAYLDTLIGIGALTKYLIFGIEHYQNPSVFHRLKTIKLGEVSFKSMDEILVVVRLIVDASATLCELQLSSSDNEEEDVSQNPSAHFLDSICPQNCTFGKLKSFKVESFGGGIQEMNFIKFLLASSPVLEVLKVTPACNDDKKCILNSVVKLLSYPRSSSGASILFEHNW